MLPSTTRLLRGRGSPWRRLIAETRYQGAQTRKQIEFDLRGIRPVPLNIFDAVFSVVVGASTIWWACSVSNSLRELKSVKAP
jgi:hypothetical protein